VETFKYARYCAGNRLQIIIDRNTANNRSQYDSIEYDTARFGSRSSQPWRFATDRDYIAKRSQYLDREVPIYWIVDSQVREIMVLTLTLGDIESRFIVVATNYNFRTHH
jgi:Putative restriction endonuclease